MFCPGCFNACKEDNETILNITLRKTTKRSTFNEQIKEGNLKEKRFILNSSRNQREKHQEEELDASSLKHRSKSNSPSRSILPNECFNEGSSSESDGLKRGEVISNQENMQNPLSADEPLALLDSARIKESLPFKEDLKRINLVEMSKDWTGDSERPALEKPEAIEVKSSLSSRDRWKRIRNSLKGIKLFQMPSVLEIRAPERLDEVFPTKPSMNSQCTGSNAKQTPRFMKKKGNGLVLQNFRNQHEFFELIKRGGPSDIEKLKEIIRNDPDRFCIALSDPVSIVNRPDETGLTPLGAAVINGNKRTLSFLLEYKADPMIKMRRVSNKGRAFKESLIETAARWKNEEIIDILLEKFQWENKDLAKAIKASGLERTRKKIRSHLPKETCIKRTLKTIFNCFL